MSAASWLAPMSVNQNDDQEQELRRAARLAELEVMLRQGARNNNAKPTVPVYQELNQSYVIGLCIVVVGTAINQRFAAVRRVSYWHRRHCGCSSNTSSAYAASADAAAPAATR